MVSSRLQLQTVCRSLHQETERLKADLDAASSRLQKAQSRASDMDAQLQVGAHEHSGMQRSRQCQPLISISLGWPQ